MLRTCLTRPLAGKPDGARPLRGRASVSRALPNPGAAASAVACAALVLAGCGERPAGPAAGGSDSLPGGPWELGAHLQDGALLVGAGGAGDRVPVLHWRPDRDPRPDTAGVIQVAPSGRRRPDPVRLGRWQGPDGWVLFGVPGASPPLRPLTRGAERYILDAGGTLWLVEADGRLSALVADTAAGFARDRLQRLEREGQVILYWATVPVPSPGGDRVAYATNREAVQRARQGQAIWLVDVDTRRERPLVSEPGQWFRPEGWLGRELLFTGGFPGIRAIDPATGDVRAVGSGVIVDVAPDAAVLAEAVGVPDSTRVRVLSRGGWAVVPLPAGGAPPDTAMRYGPQGAFATDGRRLLLQAATRDGLTRRFVIYDVESRTARWLDAPVSPLELDAWPRWLDGETLLLTTQRRGPARGTGASWVVRAP